MLTHNVQGLLSSEKMENIIETMIQNKIDVHCIQETWLSGNWIKSIRDYHVFHHNADVKPDVGHVQNGVAIVLSPLFFNAWKRAGSLPVLT